MRPGLGDFPFLRRGYFDGNSGRKKRDYQGFDDAIHHGNGWSVEAYIRAKFD